MDIAAHAFLSDCQTGALVDLDGTVDWYCPGRFDSPSVFARLLDPGGGEWSLRPAGETRSAREYAGETLVLRTTHLTPEGEVEVLDALALGPGRGHTIGMHAPHVLLRVVRGLAGRVEMRLGFSPRFEYGLAHPRIENADGGILAAGGSSELYLRSPVPLAIEPGTATARFEIAEGEVAAFCLAQRHAYGRRDAPAEAERVRVEADPATALRHTMEAWGSWSDQHRAYDGIDAAQIKRSALVLMGLTYQPSGAVVAAATTSLPEVLGGTLNWDYRYAWLRDASLMMRAEWVAACPDEPERFFSFIDRAGGRVDMRGVQIMYGLAGERDLHERVLDRLAGFDGSAPVRVGNDAWRQRQLDVLGEVLDAAHLLRDRLGDLAPELARMLRTYADQAASGWREPDSGMWEARDGERHYLSSKVMCWVALDRALALAERIGASERQRGRWAEEREAVRRAVLGQGWRDDLGAFSGVLGSNELDASVLLMPLVGFLPADDPRMRSTTEAVERELGADGLVRRRSAEDSGFLVCSFWLAECLALAGETERAQARYERVCGFANDLGLLSEMGEPATGRSLGNYPQALSHAGRINAAWTLTRSGVAVGSRG